MMENNIVELSAFRENTEERVTAKSAIAAVGDLIPVIERVMALIEELDQHVSEQIRSAGMDPALFELSMEGVDVLDAVAYAAWRGTDSFLIEPKYYYSDPDHGDTYTIEVQAASFPDETTQEAVCGEDYTTVINLDLSKTTKDGCVFRFEHSSWIRDVRSENAIKNSEQIDFETARGRFAYSLHSKAPELGTQKFGKLLNRATPLAKLSDELKGLMEEGWKRGKDGAYIPVLAPDDPCCQGFFIRHTKGKYQVFTNISFDEEDDRIPPESLSVYETEDMGKIAEYIRKLVDHYFTDVTWILPVSEAACVSISGNDPDDPDVDIYMLLDRELTPYERALAEALSIYWMEQKQEYENSIAEEDWQDDDYDM